MTSDGSAKKPGNAPPSRRYLSRLARLEQELSQTPPAPPNADETSPAPPKAMRNPLDSAQITPETLATLASQAEHKAKVINGAAGATYLCATVHQSMLGYGDGFAVMAYREQLLKDAGNPSDPLEIMLIDQITMAYHNLGFLNSRAVHAKEHSIAVMYYSTQCRLLAEFQRLFGTLETYRQSRTAQQERKSPGSAAATPSPVHNTELGSNGTSHGPGRPPAAPKPEASRGRQAKSPETQETERRRAS